MNYELVELEEKVVAGLTIRTTNENMKCVEDMGKLWEKFYTEDTISKIDGISGPVNYGVYNNYESDITKPYDYTVAMEAISDKQKDGISVVKIVKGKYAKFSAKGDMVKVVGDLWQVVWESDLDRSFVSDFETYLVGEKGPSETVVEIYISLK